MDNLGSLSLTAVGPEETDGNVFFTDFRMLMDNLAKCLRTVESRVAGSVSLRYLITDLQGGSAGMTIAPVASSETANVGRNVIEAFVQTVHQLESGEKIDPRLSDDDLLLFKKMVEPFQHGSKKLKIAEIQVTSQFVANIDKITGGSIPSYGTVKGRLEKLNVHEKNEFTLYPAITGYSIACQFDEYLFETVQKAIRKSVTVCGKLFFKPDSPFPERVHVESVEIHPTDSELPTLRSLRGIIPNATEGLTAVEFVRTLSND